jgi:hypothetical protein
MYHKRRYKPIFPNKYAGDPTNIIMRSSWETKFAIWCDNNSNIISWNSEELIIPYISPIDGRTHRYFPDFKIVTSDKKTFIVEIKPKKQCIPPQSKRKTKQFLIEASTFLVNQTKWKYAREYCKNRNWEFIILTEDHLFAK